MRPLGPSVLLAALLLAPACAGGEPATLDAAVAEDLAARADALAAGLEAGDPCAALSAAGDLVRVTAARRDAGEVPEEIAGEVIATSRDTVRGLLCEPEPEPEPPAPAVDEGDDGDEGKDEENGRGGKDDDPRWGEQDDGKGKGEGKDKDGDD